MSIQTIFEQLRKAGMTVTGALAMEGNLEEESGNESCRLQGDFTADRWKSKDYANKVNTGVISDEVFSRDGKGWGLPQFTFWSRKQGFLSHCRRRGCGIEDEIAQCSYIVAELKTDYPDLWAFLCSCGEDQLYEATRRICLEYERPAIPNTQARYNAAVRIKNELQALATEQIDNGVDKCWPPRMICQGMSGADVEVLQALLKAHGYTLAGVGGVFGVSTDKAVRKFQTDQQLVVDGIVGPKTWRALGVSV